MKIEIEFFPANMRPEEDRTVLLFDGREFFCGWYHRPPTGGFRWVDVTGMDISGVVCWAHMPIKEALNEVQNENRS